MRRGRVSSVILIAMIALTMTSLSTAASALPLTLPETKGRVADISGGETVFESGSGKKIKCGSVTGTIEETSPPLGSFHLTFTECTTKSGGITVKCTGLGDATAGEVLVLGEFHWVYDTLGTELGVAILLLLSTVHLTCGGIVLVVITGSQACLVLEPYVGKVLHGYHCIQETGKSKDEYYNDQNKLEKAELGFSESEGLDAVAAMLSLPLLLWLENGMNLDVTFMMN